MLIIRFLVSIFGTDTVLYKLFYSTNLRIVYEIKKWLFPRNGTNAPNRSITLEKSCLSQKDFWLLSCSFTGKVGGNDGKRNRIEIIHISLMIP